MADRPGLVLAVDTASLVTVGLAADGAYLGGEVIEDRMVHVEQLAPTIVAVVERVGVSLSDVSEIVVGLGPGPFTGLRVGVVTAQVLASALGARLHGICSLDPIAAQHVAENDPEADFLVTTDARRRELYWARYTSDGTRSDGPSVARPDDLPDLPAIGPGVDLYEQLAAIAGPRRLDPRTLAVRGPGLPDAGIAPLYLRRPDAAVSTRRKSVLLRRPSRPNSDRTR